MLTVCLLDEYPKFPGLDRTLVSPLLADSTSTPADRAEVTDLSDTLASP